MGPSIGKNSRSSPATAPAGTLLFAARRGASVPKPDNGSVSKVRLRARREPKPPSPETHNQNGGAINVRGQLVHAARSDRARSIDPGRRAAEVGSGTNSALYAGDQPGRRWSRLTVSDLGSTMDSR